MTRTMPFVASLVLAAALTLGGPTTSAWAAPKAGQFQTTITSPTAATGATVEITKPSKLIAKVSPGNVTFQLKVSGVTDAMDQLVNITNNTLQVDLIINNALVTQMFFFDLVNGKVSQKFTVANSSFPGGGVAAGQTLEVRALRLIQGGNFNAFGVGGLTAR